MSHNDQDIPTLTDFIRIGDEDMHHHFDAHQFTIDQHDPWSSVNSASSKEVFPTDGFDDTELALDQVNSHTSNSRQQKPENEIGTVPAEITASGSADFDPPHIAAVEIDQVPAELAPFDPALVDDDTQTDESDEYLELDVQEVISADTPSMKISTGDVEQTSAASTEDIRQQIDLAVDELLPGIAEQLKQNLYRHFQCQSDAD